MVKIEGLTEREIALRDKESKLIKITEEILGPIGKSRILSDNPRRGVFNLRRHSLAPDSSISVSVELNRVTVYYPAYFEEAKGLAVAYEKATGDEFTVKKDYQD